MLPRHPTINSTSLAATGDANLRQARLAASVGTCVASTAFGFWKFAEEYVVANPADTPADVSAEDGEVFVEGPDNIKYSFTPEAAIETSDRLLSGGIEAKGQMLRAELQRSHRNTSDD